MDPALDSLKYPIGRFSYPPAAAESTLRGWLGDIAAAPALLRAAVAGLSDTQLDTPYRPGGWTVRQLVHHVADSHINSYVRFRLALTELEPTIKTYEEAQWAELPDARSLPVEVSLGLLEALHARWTGLLGALTPEQWKRTFRHPELGVMSIERTLALYAWHGKHHAAHVTKLRERMGW